MLPLHTTKQCTRVYIFLKSNWLKRSNRSSHFLQIVSQSYSLQFLSEHQLWQREQWEVKKMSKTLGKCKNFLYQAVISNNSNYIAPSGDTLLLPRWFKTTGAACQNKLAGHKRTAWKYNFGKFRKTSTFISCFNFLSLTSVNLYRF